MPISPLNDGQYEAVITRNCSILVSAPAGSGKTKILVNLHSCPNRRRKL